MDFREYSESFHSELFHSVNKDIAMDPIDNMSPDEIARKYTPEKINEMYEKFFSLSTSNSRYLGDNLASKMMTARLKKLQLAYNISTRKKKRR